MEVIGMVFGITGMTFGLMAWSQLQAVLKELTDLKSVLRDSGILKDDSQSG